MSLPLNIFFQGLSPLKLLSIQLKYITPSDTEDSIPG